MVSQIKLFSNIFCHLDYDGIDCFSIFDSFDLPLFISEANRLRTKTVAFEGNLSRRIEILGIKFMQRQLPCSCSFRF